MVRDILYNEGANKTAENSHWLLTLFLFIKHFHRKTQVRKLNSAEEKLLK